MSRHPHGRFGVRVRRKLAGAGENMAHRVIVVFATRQRAQRRRGKRLIAISRVNAIPSRGNRSNQRSSCGGASPMSTNPQRIERRQRFNDVEHQGSADEARRTCIGLGISASTGSTKAPVPDHPRPRAALVAQWD